ncbi:hypothetical protein LAC80_36345 (plasmid) [Ensifer adhaerens]|uniref:hypothetical protein n=1 Tax=Ensifer adhaerens TaxID=106592 RepID=UPI001CC0355D|nr:hypothetical protein [Ensifer adhaerens]UAY05830.1 hypothetical protein LAC80_36345 [Ensifer adhaerens]
MSYAKGRMPGSGVEWFDVGCANCAHYAGDLLRCLLHSQHWRVFEGDSSYPARPISARFHLVSADQRSKKSNRVR